MDSRNTVHEYSNEKVMIVICCDLSFVCYCVILMYGNEGTQVPRSDRHTCLNRHSESDLVQEILLLKRYSYFIYPYSGFYNFGLPRGLIFDTLKNDFLLIFHYKLISNSLWVPEIPVYK